MAWILRTALVVILKRKWFQIKLPTKIEIQFERTPRAAYRSSFFGWTPSQIGQGGVYQLIHKPTTSIAHHHITNLAQTACPLGLCLRETFSHGPFPKTKYAANSSSLQHRCIGYHSPKTTATTPCVNAPRQRFPFHKREHARTFALSTL